MATTLNQMDVSGKTAIGTAVWFALVGAVIEVVMLSVERRANPLLRLSDDFVWMAPAALVGVTLVASLPCVLLARIRGPVAGLTFGTFVGSSLAALNLLMLVPRLSHYAAAMIAAGAAVQAARLVLRHRVGTELLVRRSSPVLVGCLAVAGAGVWLSSPRAMSHDSVAPGSRSTRTPNVLLITLDTVRADRLSLYGYSRQTTPNLDRFARRGVVFEKAFATAPWTLPSHASLFTGRWPHELSTGYSSPLDATYPTLAEYFAARSYATAGFAANLGYCSVESGLGRGFEHYEDYPRSLGQVASSSTLVRKVADNFKLRRVLRNDQHLNRVNGADLNGRVLRWLSSHTTSPFFVFINYFDAHEPYLPPKPFDTRFGPGRTRSQYSPLHHWLWDVSVAHRSMTADELLEETNAYDAALAYVDDQVGKLLDELQRRHLFDDMLVIITADHGEEFGEHAVFDHGYTLYRQALQVPLLFVAPGRMPAARRVTAPVTLRDVPSTIVDVITRGADAPFPGVSLASFWNGTTTRADVRQSVLLSEVSRVTGQPPWFPASKGDMKAAFYRQFHYIRNADGTEELYDVDSDQAELHGLQERPEYQGALVESRAALQNVIERSPRHVRAR